MSWPFSHRWAYVPKVPSLEHELITQLYEARIHQLALENECEQAKVQLDLADARAIQNQRRIARLEKQLASLENDPPLASSDRRVDEEHRQTAAGDLYSGGRTAAPARRDHDAEETGYRVDPATVPVAIVPAQRPHELFADDEPGERFSLFGLRPSVGPPAGS